MNFASRHRVQINLFGPELATLLHEHSVDYDDADFEKFFFELQTKVEISTGTMEVQDEDLRQIQRFAFDYANPRWNRELRAIFSRTLGEDLDGSLVTEKVRTEEWEPFPSKSRTASHKSAPNGAETTRSLTSQTSRRVCPDWQRRLKLNQTCPSPVAD